MKFCKNHLLLYAVTQENNDEYNFLESIKSALDGGITCLQIREKNLDEYSFTKRAIKAKGLCDKYNVPLIVNDNVDVAIKSNADGVHVGQSDADAGIIKEKYNNKLIVGVSVHNVDEAKKAQCDGADYLGIGAIFPTNTKNDADIISIENTTEIANSVNIGSVAIGGININNISKLKDTGISGIAVVSAIFSQYDIKYATKNLLNEAKRYF